MDWEGGGTTTGIDSNPNFVIDTLEGGFDPDCTDAPCPISGDASGRTLTNYGGAKLNNAEAGHENVIHDYNWSWISESGSYQRAVAVMTNFDESWLCGILFNETDHTIRTFAWGGLGEVSGDTFDAETTYYIRNRISKNVDGTFNCQTIINLTPTWAEAGAFYNDTVEDVPYPEDVGGSSSEVRGVAYYSGFSGSHDDNLDFIVDDIMLCDEDEEGTIPGGQQCSIQAPTGVLAHNPLPWGTFP
jgi:hypothetical protein